MQAATGLYFDLTTARFSVNGLPKDFKNVYYYDVEDGESARSIQKDMPVLKSDGDEVVFFPFNRITNNKLESIRRSQNLLGTVFMGNPGHKGDEKRYHTTPIIAIKRLLRLNDIARDRKVLVCVPPFTATDKLLAAFTDYQGGIYTVNQFIAMMLAYIADVKPSEDTKKILLVQASEMSTLAVSITYDKNTKNDFPITELTKSPTVRHLKDVPCTLHQTQFTYTGHYTIAYSISKILYGPNSEGSFLEVLSKFSNVTGIGRWMDCSYEKDCRAKRYNDAVHYFRCTEELFDSKYDLLDYITNEYIESLSNIISNILMNEKGDSYEAIFMIRSGSMDTSVLQKLKGLITTVSGDYEMRSGLTKDIASGLAYAGSNYIIS